MSDLKNYSIDEITVHQFSMNILHVGSLIGLTFCLWETLICFNDEVRIWQQPVKPLVKFLYYFLRYFGLSVQAMNELIARTLNPMFPIPAHTCRALYVYQIVTSYSLLVGVNIVLILRIYAMFDRSRWIMILLCLMMLVRLIMTIVGSLTTVPYLRFTTTCLPNGELPKAVLYFGFGEAFLQLIIISLTLSRYIITLRHISAQTPLPFLLTRDGSFVFAGLIAILTLISIHGTSQYAHILFPLFIAILSSSGCRLILNVHGTYTLEQATNTSTADWELTTLDSTPTFVSTSSEP